MDESKALSALSSRRSLFRSAAAAVGVGSLFSASRSAAQTPEIGKLNFT
jgi:hypothetical protein